MVFFGLADQVQLCFTGGGALLEVFLKEKEIAGIAPIKSGTKFGEPELLTQEIVIFYHPTKKTHLMRRVSQLSLL